MPTKVLWAAVSTATFNGTVDMIVTIDAIPIEKAIGTPTINRAAKTINITANACPPIIYLPNLYLGLHFHI